MKQAQTDALIVAAVLATSFLSLVLFTGPWRHLTVDGRVFSGTGGRIVLLLIPNLPFVWPYLAAGILFRRRHRIATGFRWTLVTGVLGSALHALLVRGWFPPGAALQTYVEFYVAHLLPAAFAVVAFFIWPKHPTRTVPAA